MVRVCKFPTPVMVVLALGAALLLSFWLAPAAAAADITVTTTADNTIAGDGQCTLREAVNNANANADTTAGDCPAGTYLPTDRIYLAAGLYKLQPGFDDTNQKGDLDVLSAGGGLRFIGASAGSTTISGPGYVVGTDRIFDLGVDGPAGVLIEFKGLTLSDGHAPQGGGAMYINGVFVIVEDSVIADCEATFAGGTSNNGNGGAIYMDGGSLTMLRTEMLRNTARAGVIHDVSGGAIYATNGSTISIEDSRLFGNVARVPDTGSDRTSAGAIYFSGNSLTIRNSEIISNGVGAIFSEGKGFGGAIYFVGSKLLIEESTVAQNTAGEVAGAIYS
ncbi:MAG: right-handed parallel beta-helix repeat-containing protein, partial [Caldilinea sp.]|nr:right-handed parallel beta-helix repeat-containing protein [Caldilinea sp.]